MNLPKGLVSDPGKRPAVYFLFDGEEVVYVGASKTPRARLFEHGDKAYDRVAFLPTDSSNLLTIEKQWIHDLTPKYNNYHNPKRRIQTFKIHVGIDPKIGEALDAFMDSLPYRPRVKHVIEQAYKTLLASKGFWPPAKKKNGSHE